LTDRYTSDTLYGMEKRTEVVLVRVTPDEKMAIEALARLLGVSVSGAVRMSVLEKWRTIMKEVDS
jgi:hypothetical protein